MYVQTGTTELWGQHHGFCGLIDDFQLLYSSSLFAFVSVCLCLVGGDVSELESESMFVQQMDEGLFNAKSPFTANEHMTYKSADWVIFHR